MILACWLPFGYVQGKVNGPPFVRRLDSSNICKGVGKACEQHRKEVYDMWVILALVQRL